MSASSSANPGKYFVPSPSHWPIVGSAALLTLASGAVGSLNHLSWGVPALCAGFLILFYMLFGWFGVVIRESEGRLYGKNVDEVQRRGCLAAAAHADQDHIRARQVLGRLPVVVRERSEEHTSELQSR